MIRPTIKSRYHQIEKACGELSRLQMITFERLKRMPLAGDELILEALLRRGYLASRDDESVWLAKGSHAADLEQLSEFVDVTKQVNHKLICARLRVRRASECIEVAARIIGVPENKGRMTCLGLGPFIYPCWKQYRKARYGAKLAVGPSDSRFGALDTGIALLVKALPLAGVITRCSCDGHGQEAPWVSLWTVWDDVWFAAILNQPELIQWRDDWFLEPDGRADIEGGRIVIRPKGDRYDDESLGKMLDRVQAFARRLLDLNLSRDLIDRRQQALSEVGEAPPTKRTWEQACAKWLGPN